MLMLSPFTDGMLKLLECPGDQCTKVVTLATGKAGFGRDASLAFGAHSNGNLMFITFLDLNGKDSLGSMRARMGVFENR